MNVDPITRSHLRGMHFVCKAWAASMRENLGLLVDGFASYCAGCGACQANIIASDSRTFRCRGCGHVEHVLPANERDNVLVEVVSPDVAKTIAKARRIPSLRKPSPKKAQEVAGAR